MHLHALFERLGMTAPIIQAPMAGGGDTPELAAAVSNAGGIGFVGAAYLAPDRIRAVGERIRHLTPRRFGINLFAPSPYPQVEPERLQGAIDRLRPYYDELGIPSPAAPAPPSYTFEDQLEAVLDSGAAVFSFTFGSLEPELIGRIRSRGILAIGTATTVDEALALESAGVDAIVAQGSEAGGHRGTFGKSGFEDAMIGTIALVPQVADAVSVPVIASGGIMDGRGIAAALVLGAIGAQLGTAFLTSEEAGIPECYKAAILAAREDGTRITRAFSGRPARGIVNRFLEEMNASDGAPVLPFPVQNALTRPLRNEARGRGEAGLLSLWAGQGIRMARRLPAGELVAALKAETKRALKNR